MTRETFAKSVAEEVGIDPITILTALSVLAGVLPQIIQLCKDAPPVPPEEQVRRVCRENPVVARREIRKALPQDMRRKIKTSEGMRRRFADMEPQDIKVMLDESPSSH